MEFSNVIFQSVDYLEKVTAQNPLNAYLYYTNYGICIIGVVLLFLFGLRKFIEGKASENKIASAFSRTIGTFFLINSVMLAIFYIDRIYIFFNQGARLLAEYDSSQTLIAYDYFYLTIALVAISITILHYPLERFLLNKERYPLTKIIIITLLFIPFLRLAEFYWGMLGSYIFVGLPSIFALLGFANFLIQYLKLAAKAPAGSEMRRKAIEILIGFALFLTGSFASTNWSKQRFEILGQTELHLLAPLGPIVFLFGILLLWKGYAQSKD